MHHGRQAPHALCAAGQRDTAQEERGSKVERVGFARLAKTEPSHMHVGGPRSGCWTRQRRPHLNSGRAAKADAPAAGNRAIARGQRLRRATVLRDLPVHEVFLEW